MKVVCKYCGAEIDDTCEKCPNCGATNDNLKRTGNQVPKTIEELRQWYKDHNLPDEYTTRFFIGKNIEDPKAFGIYYDDFNGKYIVYKNKADGKRAIRYQGKDEAYAVNELYVKLKEEILNQKEHNKGHIKSGVNPIHAGPLFLIHFASVFVSIILCAILGFSIFPCLVLFLTLNPGVFIMLPIGMKLNDEKKIKTADTIWHVGSFILFILAFVLLGYKNVDMHKNDAYYRDDNAIYYHYGNDWFIYDNGWNSYYGATDYLEFDSNEYRSSYDASDFKDSDSYSGSGFWDGVRDSSSNSSGWGSSSDRDWDSGSNWDSGSSWDSGSTDWDSDW